MPLIVSLNFIPGAVKHGCYFTAKDLLNFNTLPILYACTIILKYTC